MVAIKRPKPRIPKSDRKNLRLWAEGARESILRPFLADYSAALDHGLVPERALLRNILRVYFGKVHWSTKDDEEPTLMEWDPNASMTVENLSPELQSEKDRRIATLSDRIRRWFRYRVQSRNRFRRTWIRNPAKDPFARWLLNLSGLSKAKKRLQPWQQFMTEQLPLLQPNQTPRNEYQARAKAVADAAKEEHERKLHAPPDTSPQARHDALSRLVGFIGPVLQEIHNVTGCHSTLLVGGPQPEFGGDISVRHISFGRNLTASAHHWAQWDKERFKGVLAFFVEYLQTAYTPEDCTSAALDTDESNFDPTDLPPPRAVGTAEGSTWRPTAADFADPLSSDGEDSDSDGEGDGSDDGIQERGPRTNKAGPTGRQRSSALGTSNKSKRRAVPAGAAAIHSEVLRSSLPLAFTSPAGPPPFMGDISFLPQHMHRLDIAQPQYTRAQSLPYAQSSPYAQHSPYAQQPQFLPQFAQQPQFPPQFAQQPQFPPQFAQQPQFT
ncbi:hypothetical protein C8F01DRAFT_1303984 [Mycena amicta]|nr:hypothetical protein C8F01DRAFT_1303984 [Mycena amicta]